MRLIVNFGNSDIKVKESGNKDPFLPCKKNDSFGYTQRALFLESVLSNIDDLTVAEDGILSSPMYIEEGPDEIGHTFTVIDFPILKQEIKNALDVSGQDSLHVTAFVTRQSDKKESDKDTYGLVGILRGIYGKVAFPNITFDFVEINCDPSDFSEVHSAYSSWFELQTFDEEVIVTVGPGTPAMINALVTCSIRYCNRLKQYYAAFKDDKTSVIKLNFFTKSEFNVARDKLKKTFESGDYSAAKILVSEPPLSYISGLNDFVDYFDKRRNYQFKDALTFYERIKDIEHPSYIALEDCSKELGEMQSFINVKENNYDFSNNGAVFVLYESLLNAEFFYKKEQYFTAVAFLNAFTDMMTNYLIGKALGCSMRYKGDWYEGLDEIVEEKVFCSEVIQKDFESEICRWREKHIAKRDKETLIRMMLTMKEGDLLIKPDVLKAFSNTFRRQGSFKLFGKLRNSLPIAHNPKGISREEIEKTLKPDKYSDPKIMEDNKFIGVVQVFKRILEKSVPQIPKEYFEDYQKKGIEIIDSLTLDL